MMANQHLWTAGTDLKVPLDKLIVVSRKQGPPRSATGAAEHQPLVALGNGTGWKDGRGSEPGEQSCVQRKHQH